MTNELSDYEFNVRVVAGQNSITYKMAGIAASIIPFYLREVEKKLVKEIELRRVADSKHLGAVGDKLILNVQCLKVITVGQDSQFGPSYLHRLVDSAGNLVIWFSSNSYNNLKPGVQYTVKATVKKHDVRDGVNQTVVTRLTTISAEELQDMELKAARKAAREAKKTAKTSESNPT